MTTNNMIDSAPVTTVGTAAVGQIPGTTTNDNAASGKVGEFGSNVVNAGAPVSISSSTAKDIISLSLPAGDWDVWGNLTFTPTVSCSLAALWISSTSAAIPDTSLLNQIQDISGTTGVVGISAPQLRFSLGTTTTIYLTGYLTFGSGTASVTGGLYARRIR